MRVRDVMTYGAIGVPETATLAEAIGTLLRSRVSALLVFDADHALAGMLSEGDLLRRAELGTDTTRPRWLEFLLGGGRQAETYAHTHGRKVGEIMTPKVVTIAEDADLSEAVDLIIASYRHWVPPSMNQANGSGSRRSSSRLTNRRRHLSAARWDRLDGAVPPMPRLTMPCGPGAGSCLRSTCSSSRWPDRWMQHFSPPTAILHPSPSFVSRIG